MSSVQFDELQLRFQRLRSGDMEPAAFWPAYLEVLREASGAAAALAAVRSARDGAPWQALAWAPAHIKTSAFAPTLFARLAAAAEAAIRDGAAALAVEGQPLAALKLGTGGNETCLALLSFSAGEDDRAAQALRLLKPFDDVPAAYQLSRSAREALARQEQFAGLLELMTFVNARETFLSAAMTLVNELAGRHRCERVSLGWKDEDGTVTLKAISHADTFDAKMDVARRTEAAMEEALDQDADVVLPLAKGDAAVVRDHESLRQAREAVHLASLPLRAEGAAVGVATFERNTAAFAETELRLMRLALDHAVRRLADLKRREKPFYVRWKEWLLKKLEAPLAYQHTGAKVLGIAGFGALAFVLFIPVPYRLEAPAILRTDDVAYLSAPFDSHIESVAARVGDQLKTGDELLRLDQNELVLEESGLLAEKNRHARESEKARAANQLADMRIADAQYEQSAARLDIVRHRLAQAVLRAPADVVVVEGDQMERVGAPVEQGDVLFKLARVDRFYVELEVPESEVHLVKAGRKGQVALASRPQDKYRIQLERLEPAAVAKQGGNVFIARCRIVDPVPAEWRPGMTGLGKVRAGWKTLFWIFTHRTMDFLRLKLWW